MSGTTAVALLELQVWASRALIGAGFPGGAVDQAARLVALAQTVHHDAAAGFVADLPMIAARDHGVPDLGEGGRIDGRGLHALAVAPGVLDLVCAASTATVWRVAASPGAWVLPGVALQGARRGRAIVVASRAHAAMAWGEDGGLAFIEAAGDSARCLLDVSGVAEAAPADGYLIAGAGHVEPEAVRAVAARVVDAAAYARHMVFLRESGFAMPVELWNRITTWGWKMLVPTSDRSKSQAGGDMGEG